MASVAQCLKNHEALKAVSDSTRLDAELLLANTLGKSRTWLYTWPEYELNELQMQAFSRAFAKRLQGEPVAYILGEKEFWSLNLAVNNSTLIPRPETEHLVELALDRMTSEDARILDLGTGTGAIALAIAKEKPASELYALDVSEEAIALAKRNAELNAIKNVRFLESNWFEVLGQEKFSMIVSNPPYIAECDPWLQSGDVRFEPASALISEKNGLADIQYIIESAGDFLESEGSLILEHGWKQGEAVRDIFLRCGYIHIQTIKDLAGHERITTGESAHG